MWTVGLTVEIKLRLQLSPACCDAALNHQDHVDQDHVDYQGHRSMQLTISVVLNTGRILFVIMLKRFDLNSKKVLLIYPRDVPKIKRIRGNPFLRHLG